MALDLNDAQEQAERKYGPVPMGSKVLLKMEFQKPQRSHPQSPYIAVSDKGLYMAWIEFTVQAGEYEGVHWRENWMLPAIMQKVSMTEGQTKACAITYSKIRAITEANRRVSPKDKSPQASAKRQLGSIMDLNGMTFPAVLGLDKGREGTDRQGNPRVFFNNVVSTIITPDRTDYKELMEGGEWINPNGITKRDLPNTGNNGGGFSRYEDAPTTIDNFPPMPSEASDCPF